MAYLLLVRAGVTGACPVLCACVRVVQSAWGEVVWSALSMRMQRERAAAADELAALSELGASCYHVGCRAVLVTLRWLRG